MIIKNLILKNVGLFRGVHKFNLTPKENKPIILIGGKNGAGKTTMFESIRLCFYGPFIEEPKMSKREYEKYLFDKIHHKESSDNKITEASIELEFEYAHLGTVNLYKLERSWSKTGKKLKENLIIIKNGTQLTDLNEKQSQEYLNDLMPAGLSKLFFFDGEKIQNLAEVNNEISYLQDSFKSLLGLDLVEKLESDLGIYTTKHLKKIGIEDIENKRRELELEKNQIIDSLDKKNQEKAHLKSRYDQIIGEIEKQEAKLSSEGGSYAQRYDELKEEKIKLETEINLIEKQIVNLSQNLLPFAITPKYCKKLKSRLLQEEEFHKWESSQEFIDNKIQAIDQNLKNYLFEKLNYDSNKKEEITKEIANILKIELLDKSRYKDFRSIHNLSREENRNIIEWIDNSLEEIPTKLNDYSTKIETLTTILNQIEDSLNRAPDDDIIKPIIKKLNELSQKKGSYCEQINQKNEEIRKINNELAECNRNIKKQIEDAHNHKDKSNQIELCDKIKQVLSKYTLTLREAKIKEFNKVFMSYFNGLSRKEDMIGRVAVDKNNFSLSIYNKNDELIPKNRLSAGEKQIYAISILWTLTNISGRPLPFIIDTPLGRLDSDHRGTLIRKFFPHASHQIILYSTDTEVDQKYFDLLEPYITKNYHLTYSEKEEKAIAKKGYFWKNEKENADEI